MKEKKFRRDYVSEKKSNFQKGIDLQRERFKAGKIGTGTNNFDLMCDAIENIKSDIKSKLINADKKKVIRRVEKIVVWYRTLELRYTTQTEEGYSVVYPPTINFQINQNLTIAYELLVGSLEHLELL